MFSVDNEAVKIFLKEIEESKYKLRSLMEVAFHCSARQDNVGLTDSFVI
jgi:hypothetical protein